MQHPDLEDHAFESALAIHLAAYLSFYMKSETSSTSDLLQRLIRDMLGHEQNYWVRSAGEQKLRITHRAVLKRAVTAATLCSSDSEEGAVKLLARIPDLSRTDSADLHQLARWLHGLYHSDESYLAPLQPDRLGEGLVAHVVAEKPELVDMLLDGADEQQAARALTVLDRASAQDPRVKSVLENSLRRFPESLGQIAIKLVIHSPADGGLRRAVLDNITIHPRPASRLRRWRSTLTSSWLIRVGAILAVLIVTFGTGFLIGRFMAPTSLNSAVFDGITPGGTVLFEEDFASWTGRTFEGMHAYVDGRYSIVAGSRHTPLPSIPLKGSLRVQVEVETESTASATIGLSYGRRLNPVDNRGQDYQTIVGTNGAWLIRRLDHDFK